MHQDYRSALEGPPNPALIRSELRDGLRVPVEWVAHCWTPVVHDPGVGRWDRVMEGQAAVVPGGPPFTATSAGTAGGSWRVLAQRLSGGGHLVIAYSLGDLNSTVTRLEVADALAGAVAVILLGGIGPPLMRASLAPLARNEAEAGGLGGGG